MYSDGRSEGKGGTKQWPGHLKSSWVWQWLCKPLPEKKVVTGGQPGRSAGMAQGLPACLLATTASTVGHRNKDSGLSQHLAFLSVPWRQSQTQLCVYAPVHAWELTKVPHEGPGLSSDEA